jgi:hypothetical protein
MKIKTKLSSSLTDFIQFSPVSWWDSQKEEDTFLSFFIGDLSPTPTSNAERAMDMLKLAGFYDATTEISLLLQSMGIFTTCLFPERCN